MGLFNFKKGKKENVLAAPAKGKCIPISEVADPTFAEGIMGQGMAIKPADGKFYAPADGTISTIFPHAVGMTTTDGAEILIHVGLDTVQLKGQFYSSKVEEGQSVRKGDLLLEADLEEISKAGYDTVTPILICNSDAYSKIECKNSGTAEPGEDVITYAE